MQLWSRQQLSFHKIYTNFPIFTLVIIVRLQEYYSIFSVAYKLIVGFAAVGIINGVFMCLAPEEMGEA